MAITCRLLGSPTIGLSFRSLMHFSVSGELHCQTTLERLVTDSEAADDL